MKLVVGLGNPGREYERTRHNAGWLALDVLASRHAAGAIATSKFNASILDTRIDGEKVLLLKPLTFMNRSGQPVAEALAFYKLDPTEDLIVLVDEVALPVGHVRVRASGGTGGHNGLADLDRALGGRDFPRVRIGVGAVPDRIVKADWVLSRFMTEEHADADRGFALAADAAQACLAQGVPAAMNSFNKKLSPPKPDKPAEPSKPAEPAPSAEPAPGDATRPDSNAPINEPKQTQSTRAAPGPNGETT
ncbi:MAG: PTH1 family peptidyl-tRNA hydrolase [Phycisphaerales bacterium]|jgi:PTH1 family peptidyl-tRNA hydrolase